MKTSNKTKRVISRRKLRGRAACAIANQLMPEMRTNIGRAGEAMNFATPSARAIGQASPFSIGNDEPTHFDDNTEKGGSNHKLQLRPVYDAAPFSLPISYLQLCTQ